MRGLRAFPVRSTWSKQTKADAAVDKRAGHRHCYTALVTEGSAAGAVERLRKPAAYQAINYRVRPIGRSVHPGIAGTRSTVQDPRILICCSGTLPQWGRRRRCRRSRSCARVPAFVRELAALGNTLGLAPRPEAIRQTVAITRPVAGLIKVVCRHDLLVRALAARDTREMPEAFSYRSCSRETWEAHVHLHRVFYHAEYDG